MKSKTLNHLLWYRENRKGITLAHKTPSKGELKNFLCGKKIGNSLDLIEIDIYNFPERKICPICRKK